MEAIDRYTERLENEWILCKKSRGTHQRYRDFLRKDYSFSDKVSLCLRAVYRRGYTELCFEIAVEAAQGGVSAVQCALQDRRARVFEQITRVA